MEIRLTIDNIYIVTNEHNILMEAVITSMTSGNHLQDSHTSHYWRQMV